MDFLSYVIFVALGMTLGAIGGRAAMRWYWGGASVEAKSNTMYWLAVLMACAYFAARRY